MRHLFYLIITCSTAFSALAQEDISYELYFAQQLVATSTGDETDTIIIKMDVCDRWDCYFQAKQVNCNDSMWLKTFTLEPVGSNYKKIENGVGTCGEKNTPVVLMYDKQSMTKIKVWKLSFTLGTVDEKIGKKVWYLKFE